MSSQHICSSQHQESYPDSQAVASHLEVAKNIFRAESQIANILVDLKATKASRAEMEAIYSPLFKNLAMAIIGRDDIPVAPAKEYAEVFRYLCDPLSGTLLGENVELLMKSVIRYIMLRDPKRSQSGDDVRDPGMNEVLYMLFLLGPISRYSEEDIILPVVLRDVDTCRNPEVLVPFVQVIGQRNSVFICYDPAHRDAVSVGRKSQERMEVRAKSLCLDDKETMDNEKVYIPDTDSRHPQLIA